MDYRALQAKLDKIAEADLPGMSPSDAAQFGSDNHIMGKGGHDINLLQQVAKQMAKDVADGDYTAIDDLFKNTRSSSQRILRRRIMRFFEVESAVDAIMSVPMLVTDQSRFS